MALRPAAPGQWTQASDSPSVGAKPSSQPWTKSPAGWAQAPASRKDGKGRWSEACPCPGLTPAPGQATTGLPERQSQPSRGSQHATATQETPPSWTSSHLGHSAAVVSSRTVPGWHAWARAAHAGLGHSPHLTPHSKRAEHEAAAAPSPRGKSREDKERAQAGWAPGPSSLQGAP